MPVLFINLTTLLPKSLSPLYSAESVEESQMSLLRVWHRVMYPKKLLILLFPFLLFFYHGFRSWQDIKLVPFVYFSAIYTRYIVWKTAIREKIFLI